MLHNVETTNCDFIDSIFLTEELHHWEGFASHLFHIVACHDDAHWPETTLHNP